MSIYKYSANAITGEEVSMDSYKGKVLLIVNVASQCTFTNQYTGLEELYQKYKDKGFEILGFPCNQFGAQEPGNDSEIINYCRFSYNVSFPMFSKIEVNGENELPLYTFLKEQKGFEGFPSLAEVAEMEKQSETKHAAPTGTRYGANIGRVKRVSQAGGSYVIPSDPDAERIHKIWMETDPDYASKSDIKWNFTKFLVDREGNVVERFESMVTPKAMESVIEELL